jgi:hypothetical protein
MRGWEKENIEGIDAVLCNQLAAARPVQQRRPASTDVKCPGAGYGGHRVDDSPANDEETEKIRKTSTRSADRHLQSIFGSRISRKKVAPKRLADVGF